MRSEAAVAPRAVGGPASPDGSPFWFLFRRLGRGAARGRRLWRERRSAHKLLVQVFAEHSIDGRLLSVLTEPLLKAVVKEAPRTVACIIAERDDVLKQYQQ